MKVILSRFPQNTAIVVLMRCFEMSYNERMQAIKSSTFSLYDKNIKTASNFTFFTNNYKLPEEVVHF